MKSSKKFLALIFLMSVVLFLNCLLSEKKPNTAFAMVIHGGAGNITRENLLPDEQKQYRGKLEEALRQGYDILNEGGSSLDAVEKVITILEDSPLFNAGRGAVFNDLGEFELDASIMDGRTLNAGAVAGVRHIKNPILAATLVLDKSPHVLLAGDGAEEFCVQQGMNRVENSYFWTEKRKKQWEEIVKEREKKKVEQQEMETEKEGKFGTVGAVAMDKNGNLAAGTSTGGMKLKKFGRVGDSPIIGAGTYANNHTCAVSGTGHGEFFIRYAVAYDISALMEYRYLTLQEAAKRVISQKLKEAGGDGGVIGIDTKGNIIMEFNTASMYRGYIEDNGKPIVKLFGDE